jgi:xanthine dehydrogenase accessory factor
LIGEDLARRVAALEEKRVAFVLATVVRAGRPASVRAGATALVLGDGAIEGFVGGHCAEPSVRLHALRVLETGEPLVLRIVPDEDGREPEEGAVTVENPCLSGGALEIFLEPRLPAPRVSVVGDTPIAHALSAVGERLGYEIGGEQHDDDLALVVASHGRDEEESLERALRAGVPYVGLVASRRRGAAVLDELRAREALTEEDVARVRTPAGIDIGAHTAEEIALSILAEVVSVRRARQTVPGPATAIDPVCGMEVTAAEPSPHVERDGRTVWFCSEGCRERFEADVPAHG